MSCHLDTRATAAQEPTAKVFESAVATFESFGGDPILTTNCTACSSKDNQGVDKEDEASKAKAQAIKEKVEDEEKGHRGKGVGSSKLLGGTGTPVEFHPCHELSK